MQRIKLAALTGFAPVSLGLKDRDPELLDDKAVNRGAGIAVYANEAHLAGWEGHLSLPVSQRTHTVVPLAT